MPPVDVIVPVFNAFEALSQCLTRLRAHTPDDAYRLIVVDDASDDPRVTEWLARLPTDWPGARVLRQARNRGFAAAVNRGLAQSRRDVVLLNSDALVTPGWLARLQRCAHSDPRIATATPFSNHAEIASFPRFVTPNPVPDDPDGLAAVLAEAAVPRYPELPTAVGFCMYVRRTVLDRVGGFDAATYGRGYGEENDFCLRAARAGFRHVLCDDAYVVHLGSQSFGEAEAAVWKARNGPRLALRHPTYPLRVARFIDRDPILPVRAVAQSRWMQRSRSAGPGILHVSHGLEGGVGRHVRDLARATGARWRHYWLQAVGKRWIVWDLNGEHPAEYHFERGDGESWPGLLAGLCGWFDVRLIHVHSLVIGREPLLNALRSLRLPVGLTLHDFHLACPRVHLMDGDGRYCGAPTEPEQCRRCLAVGASEHWPDIAQWRRQHEALLRRARFVFAPSRWAADTFRRFFPDVPVTVSAPPEAPHRPPQTLDRPSGDAGAPVTVAVPGALGSEKGARRLERLVTLTRRYRLPLRWVVIGYLDRRVRPYRSRDGVLTVHGPYRSGELPALLAVYRPALVVYPSVVPETHSYTLSETWQAGVPALVPAVGALAERVRGTGAGWCVADWEDDEALLQAVLTRTAPQQAQAWRDAAAAARRAARNLPLAAQTLEAAYAATAADAPDRVPAACSNARMAAAAEAAQQAERRSRRWRRLRPWLARAAPLRCLRWGRHLEHWVGADWRYRIRRALLGGLGSGS